MAAKTLGCDILMGERLDQGTESEGKQTFEHFFYELSVNEVRRVNADTGARTEQRQLEGG